MAPRSPKSRLPRLVRALPVLLAGLAVATACGPAKPATPRNLLLISIDTLRADHLQPYGYPKATSPTLDRLAREGVLFELCIATSNWTLPTHTSLFTGLHPLIHGVQGPNDSLDGARTTLGERLTEAGYQTAGYFSNPFLSERFGFGRGFEQWEGVQNAGVFKDQIERKGDPKGSISRVRSKTPGERQADYFVAQSSEHVTARAADFLAERDPARPFALFLHYNDCHADYIPPAPFDWKFSPDYEGTIDGENYTRNKRLQPDMDREDLNRILALYDGEIALVDSYVGRVITMLEEQGLLEETLVVVTADHGEGFFEHKQKEHHYGLDMELVHVPWIMRLPERIPGGLRIPQQVSQADIAPTILELLFLEGLPDADGISLAEIADGRETADPMRDVTSHTILKPLQDSAGDELFALRNGRMTAIVRRPSSDQVEDEITIYAWEQDRRERRPLPADHNAYNSAPDRIEQLRSTLLARRAAIDWVDSGDALPDDPELLEQMRQWGYIK